MGLLSDINIFKRKSKCKQHSHYFVRREDFNREMSKVYPYLNNQDKAKLYGIDTPLVVVNTIYN